MNLWALLFAGSLWWVLPAAAAGETAPSGMLPGLTQTAIGLAIVLALIWVAAWLMKRLAPGAARSNALIKPLATTAVGQRERIVLVEVQNSWLLLGVAPGSVNMLHILPKIEVPSAAPVTNPFDRLLAIAKSHRSE